MTDIKVLVLPNGGRYTLLEGRTQENELGNTTEYRLATTEMKPEDKKEFSHATELVDFDKLDRRDSILAWLMCESDEFVKQLTAQEGFRGDRLDVSIVVNGITLLNQEFDKLLDHLTTVLFDQKLSNEVAAGSDGAMLIQKRRELEAKLKAFEDLTHEVEQQMWQTREYAGRLLSRQYD